MPYCVNCGTQINPGFSFCPNCGFRIISVNSTGTGAGAFHPPAPSSGQTDLVDKYLRINPGVETYDSFIAGVVIQGDIITICSALDSEIRPAAQSGDASANVVLGVLYAKGYATEQNEEKSFECFGEAALKGHPLAEWITGLIEMEADSHRALFWDLNLSRGFQWFIKSADQGYCAAMVNLGNCYSEGKGTAQNKSEALKWYRKAADQGFAPAQHKVGRLYHGVEDGSSINYPEAVKWYSKAAAQGYAPSQNNLGLCFYEGQGVPVDYSEAVRWYRKAAEQGLDVAQYNLGKCYADGRGVDRDNTEAENWFTKAAEQGDAGYQLNLARWLRWHPTLLDNGIRSYGNYTTWYRKAAEQGDAQAQFELANELMPDGFGFGESEAVEWYHKAAMQGHAGAQYELGMCYAKGRGVQKDLSVAMRWIRAAAAQGDKQAIEYLNR